MSFVRTIAINKIAAMKARKKVIQGGSSAGKTFGILPLLINKALKKPLLEITVLAGTIAHLKTGAMKDFIKIMKMTGRWNAKQWNITDRKYTFNNGSYIEFYNADQDKGTGARRNILYVNEANKGVSYEAYLQFAMRTDQDIYIDFNPANSFWPHKEVLTEPDSELLILTYVDNTDCITLRPAVSQTIIDDLLSKRKKAETSDFWKNWCKVYIDGQTGQLEGTIFNNWKHIDANIGDDYLKDATLIGYGMDFGMHPDPTVLVGVYRLGNKIILDEMIYQNDMLTPAINAALKSFSLDKTTTIWADRDKRLIGDLKTYGHNIRSADKGAGSIQEGIFTMQEYEFEVTLRSVNLVKELENYMWKEKGNKSVPIDGFNHCIDAVRYVFQMKMGAKKEKGKGPTIRRMDINLYG